MALTQAYADLAELETQRNDLAERARAIKQQIVEMEAIERGYAIGQKSEGYWHVGVKRPRWITGLITHFWMCGSRPTATIDCADGKRRAFYFDSMRAIHTGGTDQ